MRPIYDSEHGQVWHGDCIEFISRGPRLGEVIVTDPPWGHGKEIAARRGGRLREYKINYYLPETWNEVPEWEYFYAMRRYKFVCFGGNYLIDMLTGRELCVNNRKKFDELGTIGDVRKFHSENPSHWIIWDKDRPESVKFSSYELAFTNFPFESKMYKYRWNGAYQEEPRHDRKEEKFHPAQKPVGLLAGIIRDIFPYCEVVIDPFAGSGSTGLAAIRTGRRFILIEKDEYYAYCSKYRIEEHLRQGRLF